MLDGQAHSRELDSYYYSQIKGIIGRKNSLPSHGRVSHLVNVARKQARALGPRKSASNNGASSNGATNLSSTHSRSIEARRGEMRSSQRADSTAAVKLVPAASNYAVVLIDFISARVANR